MVEVAEPIGPTLDAPRVSSDLPFLRVDPPKIGDKSHVKDPTLRVRTYTYPIRFAGAAPTEGFDGRVSVVDPWAPDRVMPRNVHGEPHLPIRVAPARLILDVDGPDDFRSYVQFLARGSHAGSPLRAEMEGGGSGPLQVEAVGPAVEDGFSPYVVRGKHGRPVAEGTYHVVVRTDLPRPASLTVPVLVRRRAR